VVKIAISSHEFLSREGANKVALLESTIKRFVPEKGWGFLANPNGGEDVYFKAERVQAFDGKRLRDWMPGEQRPRLLPGMVVQFCMRTVGGRPQAIAVGVAPQQ